MKDSNKPCGNTIVLEKLSSNSKPFPYLVCEKVFSDNIAMMLLRWFENTDLWSFTKTEFYTQYEFSLLDLNLPGELKGINSEQTVMEISKILYSRFLAKNLLLVGITAHKLLNGYRMGVHNDFIGKDETHRLVIQLNENWQEENGGFLMFFNSDNPKDVAEIVRPVHNTGVAFEISQNSHHAVSTVHNFERYTLVYTFSQEK